MQEILSSVLLAKIIMHYASPASQHTSDQFNTQYEYGPFMFSNLIKNNVNNNQSGNQSFASPSCECSSSWTKTGSNSKKTRWGVGQQTDVLFLSLPVPYAIFLQLFILVGRLLSMQFFLPITMKGKQSESNIKVTSTSTALDNVTLFWILSLLPAAALCLISSGTANEFSLKSFPQLAETNSSLKCTSFVFNLKGQAAK